MEQERGNDIRWVKPEPGFVVKTSVTEDVKSVSGGPTAAIKSGAKVFVNICSSVEIQQATAKAGQGEVRGQHWSLPYSLNPPREDRDKCRMDVALS